MAYHWHESRSPGKQDYRLHRSIEETGIGCNWFELLCELRKGGSDIITCIWHTVIANNFSKDLFTCLQKIQDHVLTCVVNSVLCNLFGILLFVFYRDPQVYVVSPVFHNQSINISHTRYTFSRYKTRAFLTCWLLSIKRKNDFGDA